MVWLIETMVSAGKKAALPGSVLAFLISGSVFADCGKDHVPLMEYKHIPGLMELHFSDLDTDADGMITRQEFNSKFTTSGNSSFEHMDRDSSSGLDRGEWNRFKVMHTGMGSHHGNHRGGS